MTVAPPPSNFFRFTSSVSTLTPLFVATKLGLTNHKSSEKKVVDKADVGEDIVGEKENDMSTLKKRNGVFQYHHGQFRFSLKTKDKKIALELKNLYDLKRLTGQLDQKRLRILELTTRYTDHVRKTDTITDTTKVKVLHQIAMFIEFVRINKCDKYLDEITPDLFHRYAGWREIMSIKNDMMSLNKMFKWGESLGYSHKINVPVSGYTLKKSHKHRAITHDEFLRLHKSTHSELYKWLYYTGLRPGDAIKVHSSAINGRILTIIPQKTTHSSGKEVTIILHRNIEYVNADGFMLPEYLANPSLLDAARRDIKKILGKEVTLYSLRYSFNARLKELGADLETRKDAMGHTNIRTTEGYSTQNVSQLARYIDMMD
jgi:integrase